MVSARPNYGIDAPGVIRNLFLAALIVVCLAIFLPTVRIGSVTFILRPMFWNTAPALALGGVLMLIYAKWGKFRHRDRMLSLIPWTGGETVLDVGTGRGLLMIGAARKLTAGRSIGIDIWSDKDLSGNRPENTLRNAELEGVADKVEVRSEDATTMKFPDAIFDVVLSNLCIHNIPTREGRDKACREIVRVLKPGGVALISDFLHLGQYAHAFQQAGATAERAGWFLFDTFPPLGILRVKKTASARSDVDATK
jgi:arsenite methyltransferase